MSSLLAIDFRKTGWPQPWFGSVVAAMVILSLWVATLLYFGFSLPTYAAAMLAIGAIIFVRPTVGLPVIILGTMWFERWFTLQPIIFGDQAYKLYPLDAVFVVTVLAFLFHQAFGRSGRRYHFAALDALILAFMGLCAAYLLFSLASAGADAALAFSAFKNYAFYAGLFWLVGVTVQSREELITFMKTFLIGGLGIIAFVGIGLARGQGLWTEYTPLSTEGVRLLAFPHAFYLCLALVISLVLLIYHLRPARASLFAMWAQLVGVIGSLMRHLWVTLVLVAGVVFLAIPRSRKKHLLAFFSRNAAVIALLAVLMAFVVLVFPRSDLSLRLDDITGPLYQRARSLVYSAADSSARWRVFAWRAAQESFVQHPVLGIGYGQELAIDFETYFRVIPIRDLHNSYLVLVVQMGLIGSLAFVALLWQAVKLFWRAARQGRGLLWPYQLAFFSAWSLFLLAAVWQPYFETNLTGIFFWILLGAFTVSISLDMDEPSLGS